MRFLLILFLIVLVSQVPQVLFATKAQQIDTTAVYRLTNDFGGPGKSFSVNVANRTVVMADTRDSPEQHWKLTPVGNGKYRLTNIAAGDGMSLDTPMSGGNYVMVMAGTGFYTGQIWTLTPLGGNKYRLTNDYAGPGKSFDTWGGGGNYQPVMAGTGLYTGQFWTLTKIGQPVAAQPQPMNRPDPAPPPTIAPPIITPQPTNGATVPVGHLLNPTSSNPAVPAPLAVMSPAVLTWNPSMIPRTGGERLCSAPSAGNCGTTKADWVGSHTLNMKCEKGFYDPIWGGTCWDFPPTNDKGAWIRSADPVTSDTAVWRAPKESLARAEKVKSTAWAWECPSGSFWDGYDGGGCWKCPADYPRRTANPVSWWNACASPMNETARAVFINYNGCSKPDPVSMGLTGKRMPGKPFLHIGSGCYACPNADEEGNILITERNANLITGDAYANNQGCTILFKWKPPVFPEPGLSGLAGVKEILFEYLLFDEPNILTTYFTKMAQEVGHQPGTPQSLQYVGQQWQEVANGPYKSKVLANLLFGILEVAAETDANARTPAERMLIGHVEEYVRLRRTFIAEQALAMYDAWKTFNDQRRARGRLEVMGFDYGEVPFDFQAAATAGFGLGSAGSSVAGAIVGANKHAVATAKIQREAVTEVRPLQRQLEQARLARDLSRTRELESTINRTWIKAAERQRLSNLFESVKAFRVLSLASKVGLLLGATAIQVAGTILITIAIEQFMKIIEARPNLENAITLAQQPVDLKALLAETNGKDQLTYYWSKAMDARPVTEDQQILAKARAAMETARQRGYRVPSGQ